MSSLENKSKDNGLWVVQLSGVLAVIGIAFLVNAYTLSSTSSGLSARYCLAVLTIGILGFLCAIRKFDANEKDMGVGCAILVAALAQFMLAFSALIGLALLYMPHP